MKSGAARSRNGFLLACIGAAIPFAVFAGCVGDDPQASSSNESDAATPDTSVGADVTNDVVTTSDSGSDASAPACDLSKPFGTPQPLPGVTNTSGDENGFHLTKNGLIAAYARSGSPPQIYLTSRTSLGDSFGAGSLSEVNGVDAGGASPSLSGDGLDIFFFSGGPPFRLFTAHRTSTGALFDAPGVMAGVTNGASQIDPYVLPDKSAFYFDDDATSILRAAGTGSGFTAGVALNELAGGGGLVKDPIVTNDELTIYWSTNRSNLDAGGSDGYDIWMGTRTIAANPFSQLHAVDEVNSNMSDAPTFITADGCTLYMNSSRAGGPGGQDIYVATKPK